MPGSKDRPTPASTDRSTSARFWDEAAKENAAWYVANAYREENESFFAQGKRETDEFLSFCNVEVTTSDVVLEIGSGVGRMTKRLAERSARVIATDVSAEMLVRARVNLDGFENVEFLVVPGDGTLGVATASVDVVFSYIVLQHVPSADEQIRYLCEALRTLRSGGRLAVQIRASGMATVVHEWIGYGVHLLKGRKTMSRAWRGARVPRQRILDLASEGVTVELRRSTQRHVWVIARKS